MDPRQARDELKVAHQASTAGAIPRLGALVPIEVGVLVAGAVTLAGWASENVWWHLTELASAVLLACAAVLVLVTARRRRGIRGLRGPARSEWTATLVSALAFLVIAFGASPEERGIYVGLGVLAGVLTGALLHRRGA